jgi:hypothetical protein
LVDHTLLRIGNATRSVGVRYTCERCVHCAGGQFGIGYSAKAAGFVDVDLSAVLRRGDRHEQKYHGDQNIRRLYSYHLDKGDVSRLRGIRQGLSPRPQVAITSDSRRTG